MEHTMYKTIFNVSKMDCPSEEHLIRMKLEPLECVKQLNFDIPNRQLTVFHRGSIHEIEQALLELKLGERKQSTESVEHVIFNKNSKQSKLLWTVLVINFIFFIVEITTGVFSKSMGLIADSLDMLADALVYGMSLLAVGGSLIKKKAIAKRAGYLQIALACIGFIEVLRRFFGSEQFPNFSTMIFVSVLALFANGICLYLLQKSKSNEAHMKASMIFTSNDIIINLGIITAGLLVNWLQSDKPDLIIGTIVFVLVIQGAYRILKLS